MDRFSIFDQILDCVFVVDVRTTVIYANHAASELVGWSQKRLIGKKTLPELFQLELYPFPFGKGSPGHAHPSSYLETKLNSVDGRGRSGKVQLAVTPWEDHLSTEPLWVFILKDVSLEEALHSKYKSELEQKEGYIEDLKRAHAQLEQYSKNLESLVEERTLQLKTANLTLKAIIDSLGQGFLTFNRNGQCGDIFTKACESLLDTNPAGKMINQVLQIESDKMNEFKMWMETVFAELLPFEDMKALGPSQFLKSKDKSVFLEYFPIRNEVKSIEQVVLVATDRTSEVEAQKKLMNEQQFVEMVLKFVKNRKQFIDFLRTILPTIDKVDRASLDEGDGEKELLRVLHTLEGEAGTFGLTSIRMAAKAPQRVLQNKNSNWRSDFKETLNQLRTEYQTCLNQLQEPFGEILENESDTVEVPRPILEQVVGSLKDGSLRNESADLLASFMERETVQSNLEHFNGLLKGLGEKLGKRLKPIHFSGADAPIDVKPLRPLFSSLVHIFRNSVDHGIEAPDERQFIGKPEQGQISIECEMNAKGFILKVKDDGRGINPKVIRKKLQEKFPGKDFFTQSDEEVIQNIFLPGFSSRDEVGEFSGRGIGMDAVRTELDRLGGGIVVLSTEGQGTEFVMEVPPEAWLNEEKAA